MTSVLSYLLGQPEAPDPAPFRHYQRAIPPEHPHPIAIPPNTASITTSKPPSPVRSSRIPVAASNEDLPGAVEAIQPPRSPTRRSVGTPPAAGATFAHTGTHAGTGQAQQQQGGDHRRGRGYRDGEAAVASAMAGGGGRVGGTSPEAGCGPSSVPGSVVAAGFGAGSHREKERHSTASGQPRSPRSGSVIDLLLDKVESNAAASAPMAYWHEFKKFVLQTRVMETGVGVIVGRAFQSKIYRTVEEAFADGAVTLNYGRFAHQSVNFFAVGLSVYWFLRGGHDKRPCPECMQEIPVMARRCAFCCIALPAPKAAELEQTKVTPTSASMDERAPLLDGDGPSTLVESLVSTAPDVITTVADRGSMSSLIALRLAALSRSDLILTTAVATLISTLLVTSTFSILIHTSPAPSINYGSLGARIDRLRASRGVNAMTVGVVVDGEVAWTRAFGDASSTRTLFQIGSNTKAFASFAVAQVVDDGNLSWESPVTTLAASGIKSFSDPIAGAIMNLKDCLSHRSGMGLHPYIKAYGDRAARIPELAFSRPIRDSFEYNNLMVTMAADIAANASGLAGWGELVLEKIFKPLGMERSYAHPLAVPEGEDMAVGYSGKHSLEGEGISPPGTDVMLKYAGGAGGIVSNVDDLLKWVKMFLNEGKIPDSDEIMLRSDMFAELVTPQTQIGKKSFTSYGLGWFLDLYNNEKRYAHGGQTFGFSSYIALLPKRKGAVIVLTNSADETGLPMFAANSIIDSVFYPNDRTEDWVAAAAAADSERLDDRLAQIRADDLTLDRSNATTLPLPAYAGVYTAPGYGRLSVSLTEEPSKIGDKEVDLVATLWDASYQLAMSFSHWGGDRFGLVEDSVDHVKPDGGAYTFGEFIVKDGVVEEFGVALGTAGAPVVRFVRDDQI
ncbi:hypothetical protein HK101_011361 [Irineochytrium annulatum]|nr:hypothetical protein HK101_011361 [Irineochytrium annulatum]